MMRRALGLALLLGLAPALAPPARAQELNDVLARFAAAWARGDVGGLAALISRSGVTVDIGTGEIGPLPGRQAAAVLRRLFDERETTAVQARFAQVVGGAPTRAFGEIRWHARSRGTTESEGATIFLALVRESGTWRINQIRLLQ